MQFDTGSERVYVVTEKCTDKNGCEKKVRFDASHSDSFKVKNNVERTIEYGTGMVKGHEALDKVCLSSSGSECFSMTFLAVEKAKDIEVDEFSGIVGLSPSNTPHLGHQYLD